MATSKQLRIENLRTLVKEFKTAEAVARLAETAPMYLSQILNGAKSSTGTPRGIGDTLARKLEAGCGKEVGWMDRDHSNFTAMPMDDVQRLLPGASMIRIDDGEHPDIYLIPKVQLQLSAGVTGFQTIPEIYDGGTLTVAKNWVDRNRFDPSRLIAISVKGESMEPNLYAGDMVIINTDDREKRDGAVYAFNYEGEAVIKRLTRDMGQWWLSSDNPDQRKYHRKSCQNGDCIIIGRVVRRETDVI